jgi:hypothetical protein
MVRIILIKSTMFRKGNPERRLLACNISNMAYCTKFSFFCSLVFSDVFLCKTTVCFYISSRSSDHHASTCRSGQVQRNSASSIHRCTPSRIPFQLIARIPSPLLLSSPPLLSSSPLLLSSPRPSLSTPRPRSRRYINRP